MKKAFSDLSDEEKSVFKEKLGSPPRFGKKHEGDKSRGKRKSLKKIHKNISSLVHSYKTTTDNDTKKKLRDEIRDQIEILHDERETMHQQKIEGMEKMIHDFKQSHKKRQTNRSDFIEKKLNDLLGL